MADAQQQRQERQQKWGQIVAKAWQDEAFKARLLADPRAVFEEHGMQVPEGTEVKVVENTASQRHLILPPKPDSDELSDDELDKVAGGVGTTSPDYANTSSAPGMNPTTQVGHSVVNPNYKPPSPLEGPDGLRFPPRPPLP